MIIVCDNQNIGYFSINWVCVIKTCLSKLLKKNIFKDKRAKYKVEKNKV